MSSKSKRAAAAKQQQAPTQLVQLLNRSSKNQSRQRGRARTVTDKGSNRRNDYLATLLDPENVKGVGIPDFDTYPANCVQTSKRFRVTTDAAGNWCAVLTPAMYRGILYPGIDGATGNYHSVSARNGPTAPAAPAGTTFAAIDSVITDNDRAFFCTNYASIRPVSMAVKTEPIGPALTMSGDLLCTTLPAEAQVFPASYSTLAATGFETLNLLENPTYVSPADVMSGKGQLESLTRETVTTWRPEGPVSYEYASVPANALNSAIVDAASVGNYANQFWVAGSANPPATADVAYFFNKRFNAAASTGIQNSAGPSVVSAFTRTQAENDILQPTILLQVEGGPVSTIVMEVEVLINWECIPRNAVSALIPTMITYANPDELAQAGNVIHSIPATHYPGTPSMPANNIRTLAIQSTGHLYDPSIHRQDAVTGASLFTRIRRGVGGFLKGAAGVLMGVPKAGPLLSGGAALLGSLLSR